MTGDGNSGRGGAFGEIDAKLTVFALANGMDLIKDDAWRRLEWFTEGKERGLRITAGASGFTVHAMAWPFKHLDQATESEIATDTPAPEILAILEGGIEAANAL